VFAYDDLVWTVRRVVLFEDLKEKEAIEGN
jgi:hypothetical protein